MNDKEQCREAEQDDQYNPSPKKPIGDITEAAHRHHQEEEGDSNDAALDKPVSGVLLEDAPEIERIEKTDNEATANVL